MNYATQKQRSPRRERGAVLVVGLIFLAMLSLLGVAAHSVATQEERMSGNTRERVRAFQGAEASLRDCEALILPTAVLPTFTNNTGGFYVAKAVSEKQYFESIDWTSAAAVRVLPSGAAITGVARQPRCIVEEIGDIFVNVGGAVGLAQKETLKVYRITAVGYGANGNTSAQVQTTYIRPPA